MKSIKNLNRLAYFVAVIEAGSITAAALRLGITKAVVSQQIARLEQDVGVSLVLRTTRQLRITEAGKLFYERCSAILKETEDAYSSLANTAHETTGLIRITAPFDYGSAIIATMIPAFVARYKSTQVELVLSDARLDLLSNRLDVAIHVGWLKDSSNQARRIRSFEQLLVCSEGFAANLPEINEPAHLRSVPLVANMALREPLSWTFSNSVGEYQTIELTSVIAMDSAPAVLAAVMAGGGVSILPDYLVATDVTHGRLRRLLPNWSLSNGGIHAVFPNAHYRPQIVRSFIDMLIEHERFLGASSPV
ncbi:MAG: LysR substrate-binding domain-containing protein [Pseudomonadota bacterium]|nr:LysR substrate-binding domain-containing protein [Pseudomonadota bacterium]